MPLTVRFPRTGRPRFPTRRPGTRRKDHAGPSRSYAAIRPRYARTSPAQLNVWVRSPLSHLVDAERADGSGAVPGPFGRGRRAGAQEDGDGHQRAGRFMTPLSMEDPPRLGDLSGAV